MPFYGFMLVPSVLRQRTISSQLIRENEKERERERAEASLLLPKSFQAESNMNDLVSEYQQYQDTEPANVLYA